LTSANQKSNWVLLVKHFPEEELFKALTHGSYIAVFSSGSWAEALAQGNYRQTAYSTESNTH
jgi:hypothetical protein